MGIYQDEDLQKAVSNLKKALEDFTPKHRSGAHQRGTTKRLLAKAKTLVNLAKNIELAAKYIDDSYG